jgi:hypothetical protein
MAANAVIDKRSWMAAELRLHFQMPATALAWPRAAVDSDLMVVWSRSRRRYPAGVAIVASQ